MKIGRGALAWIVLMAGLQACRGAAPPLPPIPASSGTVLLPPGPAPARPDDEGVVDRVVAVVNGDVIMMSELQEAVALYLRETKEAAPASVTELQQKVLTRMVDHRLQVQEARREKVDVGDDEVQAAVDDFVRRNGGDRARVEAQLRAVGLTWEVIRRELRDQLLVQRIRGRRVARRANVTEAEVDAYLAENRAKLEAGLKYRPRHLAILAQPPGEPAAWEQAKAEIERIVARLREGADFAELAREHSRDGSAAAGGDLGWLARGELQPLFEEPILALKNGEVTAPIRSSAGYHIFRLEEQQELTPEMLAQFRDQARDLLGQRKAHERFEEWVEGLRRKALIAVRL